MPGRLFRAVSERTIRCCFSSHPSADKMIDFLSILQFESKNPFVCPKKNIPLASVKVFTLITLKHQNPNTSHDASKKLWKEKLKIYKSGKRKLYLQRTFQQTHLTKSIIVSHWDNRDALSKVEFSRGRIQNQPKQPRGQLFQQTHQTTNTILSHWDNRDAVSKVEFSRERIQKQLK